MFEQLLATTGNNLLAGCRGAGRSLILFKDAARYFRIAHRNAAALIKQMDFCGVSALPLVAAVAGLTGMIMALQTGYELSRFGLEDRVGAIIGATMCRELGPVWAAVIVTACAGAAMAAELGTMKVSEEIDALEVMSIDPVRFLVMPRILAMILVMPILAVFSDVIGIVGGSFVANSLLDVSYTVYFDRAWDFLVAKDIYSGMIKAAIFGAAISTISCDQGLSTKGGAEGVGKTTIRAVIISLLLILVLDFLLTSLFTTKAM